MVEIRQVASKSDINKFVAFPDKLYKGVSNYIPELKAEERSMLSPETNASFKYCDARFFLAYRDGQIVGRIGGIVNRTANEQWGQKRIRITRVDFIDDMEVSGALLGAVESWAKELGLTQAHGPLGFTDLDKEGMLVEGFDRMGSTVTIYNFPYYPKHFEAHGYVKDTDWIEFRIRVPEKGDERIARVSRLATKVMERTHVHFFDIKNMKEVRPIVMQIFDLLSECYKHLYGVVPYTEEVAKEYTERFLPLLIPDFVKLIVDDNGKLIAFGLAAPSLAAAFKKCKGHIFPLGWAHLLHALKHPKELELYLVAVHPDYQKSGLPALMMNEITASAIKRGVKFAESSPELETNKHVQDLWKSFDVEQHKRRRCYKKDLV